jgi:undecaprenyl pyrophosphate phosphatase UppP
VKEETMEQLLTKLDALAAKLGVSADIVWAAFMKQMQLRAALLFLVLIVLGSLVGVCWYQRRLLKSDLEWEQDRAEKDEKKQKDLNDGLFVVGLIIVVLGVVSFTVLVKFIPYVVNPEYYAVRELLWRLN